MRIELTERELMQICNNVVKQVARYVDQYIDEPSETEKGVYLVEVDDLVEQIISIDVDLSNMIQPL